MELINRHTRSGSLFGVLQRSRSFRNPIALPAAAAPSVRKGVLRAMRLSVLAALVACSDGAITSPLAGGAPRRDAVKFWETNAAVYWNGVSREMVIANRSPAPVAIRGYAIVSVAKYHAAVAAEKEKNGDNHPSVRAAIGAAAVTALSYLYPARAADLESRLEHFLADPATSTDAESELVAGVAIGRRVGEQIVERARADNFFTPGSVDVPDGECAWSSANPPIGALWGQAKTFLLLSGSQFRPAPPPTCDSPEFETELAEVREFSDSRTPEQDANAKFWDFPAGTYTPPGYWNEEAARLAVMYRRSERETAHLFALANMVSYDAIVASHEAKYFYWLLRPTMADPSITLSIPLPNFPSYPSNHAAVSAAMARILADRFPAEKSRLEALADEAALSRVLAGIHYRFDGEAGLALGRKIAEWALAHDVSGHEAFELR